MTSENDQTEDFDPHETADDFATEFEGPSESRITYAAQGSPRDWIGPYKILKKIAQGGMGAVYLAEQDKPIKRQVAVKVIRAEKGDSEQIVSRFEAERQALALMEHPNIARVLQGGQTAEGAPYFAMELVNGVPFTHYCDEKKLSIRDRLELFIPVCRAVQHAHQKGIIHRDLKPNNVLVTEVDGVPVPKVIDFGLAKATDQKARLTDKTMATEMGDLLGTIQYMSPEQAELDQLDIDTRTDIYSLGVMLYELLTGSTPLDKETRDQYQLRKLLDLICEREPPKPSARLSDTVTAIQSVSEQRKIQPSKLQQILRGELDWIVMKALEKERSRRYATANDFAADIGRFLNHEAVVARPPSAAYRFKKSLRRYRITVAIVAAFMITNFTLLALVTRWFYEADNEKNRNAQLVKDKEELLATEKQLRSSEATARQKAEKESADQMAATQFLFNIFGAGDPLFSRVISPYGVEVTGDTSIKDVLSAALANEIDDSNSEFQGKPLLRSRLLAGLGDMAVSNSQLDLAGQAFSKSLQLLDEKTSRSEAEVKIAHAKLLVSRSLLDLMNGNMHEVETKILQAKPVLAKAVASHEVMDNLLRAYEDCSLILGLAYVELDRLEEARQQFQELSQIKTGGDAAELRRLSGKFFDLATQFEILERDDQSLLLVQAQLLPLFFELSSKKDSFNQSISIALDSAMKARFAFLMGQSDASVNALESLCQAFSDSLGEEHILNAIGYFFLSISLKQLDRNPEALSYSHKLMRLIDNSLGERRHPILCFYLKQQADMYIDLWIERGKKEPELLKRAMDSIDESLRIGEQAFGDSHWRIANAYYGRGRIHGFSRNFDAALADFQRSFDMACEELGTHSKFASYSLREMAKVHQARGDLGAAESRLRQRVIGLDHPDASVERLGRAQFGLAEFLWQKESGQLAEVRADEIGTLLSNAIQNMSKGRQYLSYISRAKELQAKVDALEPNRE